MPSRPKLAQIIEKAGEMFTKYGYEKVSMDAISAAVPVSKATLYNNFKDKKELFTEVISARCNAIMGDMIQALEKETSVDAALRKIGVKFLNMILLPDSLKIHRIIAAEQAEFPEMAMLFYKSGPARLSGLLENYLREQDKLGNIKAADPALSAQMFLSMIKGYIHMQCLFGLRKDVTVPERKKIIEHAVGIFLTGHR